MRLARCVILVAELVLLALVLAVPSVDLPQTAFNEVDTPINQATVPVVVGYHLPVNGLHPIKTAPATLRPRPAASRLVATSSYQHDARFRSLLALLCAFLC